MRRCAPAADAELLDTTALDARRGRGAPAQARVLRARKALNPCKTSGAKEMDLGCARVAEISNPQGVAA